MKALWKIVLGLVVVAIAGVLALEGTPRRLSGVVEQAFGYRLQDEVQVVGRKHEKPFSINGVSYWEETTLRLTEVDYRNLISRLSSDHSFTTKKYGIHEIHERFIVGHELVSWSSDDSVREFWFSFSEY